MRGAKHGIRGLGLVVLAALGTMAFTAVGAQAQAPELPGKSTAGTFLYNLATPAGQAVTGEQLGTGYLLVQARDLKIECGSLDINEGVLTNATEGKFKVLFLGCTIRNHKSELLAGCEFKELGGMSASFLVLLILHGGERFVLFEPLEGTNFAIVSFKPNLGCVLPLNNPKTGSFAAKVEGGLLDAEVQTIVFSEAIQLLSGDLFKYGALGNTGYLNGTIDLEGVAEGSKLGIH